MPVLAGYLRGKCAEMAWFLLGEHFRRPIRFVLVVFLFSELLHFYQGCLQASITRCNTLPGCGTHQDSEALDSGAHLPVLFVTVTAQHRPSQVARDKGK